MKSHNEHYTFLQDNNTLGVRPQGALPNPLDPFSSKGLLQGSIPQLLDTLNASTGIPGDTCYTHSDVSLIPACPRPPHHLKPIRLFDTDKEREDFLRWCELRAERPYLERKQHTEQRFPKYYEVALDMLKDGYHRAFTEFFDLICDEDKECREHRPFGHIWVVTPISHQQDKINHLKSGLYAAEDASRAGNYAKQHETFNTLASYFENHPDDLWLFQYFLQRCLDAAYETMISDSGLCFAATYLRLAMYHLGLGNMSRTEHYFNEVLHFSREHDWISEKYGNKMYRIIACEHLTNILLDRCRTLTQPHQLGEKLACAREAYNKARESGNAKLKLDTMFDLCQVLFEVGEYEECHELLEAYLIKCQKLRDFHSLAQGSHLMALLCEKLKKGADCLTFFQDFIYLCDQLGETQNLLKALEEFGVLLMRMGKFKQSNDCFMHALHKVLNLHPPLNNGESLANVSRTLAGVTVARQFVHFFSAYVFDNKKCSLQRLVQWKSSVCNAREVFDLPVPETP